MTKFLQELDFCDSVEELKTSFGVGDNFPIFLKTSYYGFIDQLESDDRFKVFDERKFKTLDRRCFFDYVPGVVRMQVINGLANAYVRGSELDRERQKDYTVTLTLHPYQPENHIAPLNPTRTMAEVIRILGKYAIDNGIPACFPHSSGSQINDFERIAYND